MDEQIGNLKKELQKEIKDNQPVWKTSGPVQTTVGFVEDNSEVANEVTFQEAMDAIFMDRQLQLVLLLQQLLENLLK